MTLQLKVSPELKAMLRVRPPVRLKLVLIKEYHLKNQLELSEPTEEQKRWALRKLKKGSRSWERWDGMIGEWQSWSKITSEFINIWRCYKK
jgi:hypothetical protein